MLRYVKKNEEYIYIALWTVAFIAPLIVMAYHAKDTAAFPPPFGWKEVLITWRFTAVFLAVFLLHNFFVAPQLVYYGRRLLYFLQFILMAVGFQVLSAIVRPPRPQMGDMGRHMERMAPDARSMASGARPMDGPRERHRMPPREGAMEHERQNRFPDPMVMFHRGETVMIIVLFLVLLLNIGVKFYFKSEDERRRISDLEKRNLEQQLEYLKFQINPHFFMNTLNNIHALVDIDPEQAKYMVVVLSKMMRYILYDGERRVIPLTKEVDFILNYVDLMRIRYPQQVEISVDIDGDMPEGQVPPLLLITFIENAFKHGVSMRNSSFIRIRCAADAEAGMLQMDCINSKHAAPPVAGQHEGGVGLTNARRRLGLIYGEHYRLDIVSADKVYEVHLSVPLNPPEQIYED